MGEEALYDHLSMKNKIGIGSFAVVIAFVGWIFIRAGMGEYTPFLIFGICCVLVAGVILILTYTNSKRKGKKAEQALESFKQRANKVLVNLENFELNNNSWTEEVVDDSNDALLIEQALGYHEATITYEKHSKNVIDFKIPYQSEIIQCREVVNMDPVKLKMHFAVRKETTLYVDPNDSERYYLDLEFLYN